MSRERLEGAIIPYDAVECNSETVIALVNRVTQLERQLRSRDAKIRELESRVKKGST